MQLNDWATVASLVLAVLLALGGAAQWILSSPGRTSGTYKNLSDTVEALSGTVENLSLAFDKEKEARQVSDRKVFDMEQVQAELLLQLKNEKRIRVKLISIVRGLVKQLRDAGMESDVSGADLAWLNNGILESEDNND